MAASTVGGQFSMGVVICNMVCPLHMQHIFLLSIVTTFFCSHSEEKKSSVFCLACRDARRGVVQITTGCIAGF
jgi:hypothetical protein